MISRRTQGAQQAGALSGVGQAGRPRLTLSGEVEPTALFAGAPPGSETV
jgi:hypothetical protein